MRRPLLVRLLTIVFAAVFAAAGLGHAPAMTMASMLGTADCHTEAAPASASAVAAMLATTITGAQADHRHADGGMGTAEPAAMVLAGCPLASLPPLPAAATVPAQRMAMRTGYPLPPAAFPASADLDRADPPPRHNS